MQPRTLSQETRENDVVIPTEHQDLHGELIVPSMAVGIVLFAHGSGSSRHSPRNQFVARALREQGLGTLLFDLLTQREERDDYGYGHRRFNIELLAERLVSATEWLTSQVTAGAVGYFGASTGAAAALVAAAQESSRVSAVVSRGGRPDLAADALLNVECPTLFLVGENDREVIRLNERSFSRLRCEKEMQLIPGATHLFEEPGALEKVSERAAAWFTTHLSTPAL